MIFLLRKKEINMAKFKTYSPKLSEINSSWRLIDADGKTLGRLASEIATILRGKDKPTFTRHMIMGDFVVVINAEKIRVTGQKAQKKKYYRHTQYPSGFRQVSYQLMSEKFPERIIEFAVKGMLPHNALGHQLMRRLHVYAGPNQPHEAQLRAGEGKKLRVDNTEEESKDVIEKASPRKQRKSTKTTDSVGTVNSEKDDQIPDKKVKPKVKKKAPSKARAGKKDS